jgi:hypothetical protein
MPSRRNSKQQLLAKRYLLVLARVKADAKTSTTFSRELRLSFGLNLPICLKERAFAIEPSIEAEAVCFCHRHSWSSGGGSAFRRAPFG